VGLEAAIIAPVSEPTRRSFLDTLLWTSLAATGVACLAPVPFYLMPPDSARPRRRMTVGKRGDFPAGKARKFADIRAIVLNDGELRAFDYRCTHQECPVNWDEASMKLKCPCHGAVFSSKGEPLAGPNKGPLAALRVDVTAAGDVVVGEP